MRLLVGVVGAALFASCLGSASPSATDLVFSFLPLDPSVVTSIVPLGNLNPAPASAWASPWPRPARSTWACFATT